jgi:hypothetical protein
MFFCFAFSFEKENLYRRVKEKEELNSYHQHLITHPLPSPYI